MKLMGIANPQSYSLILINLKKLYFNIIKFKNNF